MERRRTVRLSTRMKTDRQTAIFLLSILKALLNEMVCTKQIDKSVSKYIYDSVRYEAQKFGWVE